MIVAVKILENTASPELKNWLGALRDRKPMHLVLGRRLMNELQGWFDARNLEPNKRGWRKSNFWARISAATSSTHTEKGATVVIADPAINQKIHGGTIRPKAPRKALAIPIREEAYGVRAGSGLIAGLFLIRSKVKRRAYLARNEGSALRVYYVLVKSVTQRADPKALPSDASITAALQDELQRYLTRLARRTQSN